VDASGCWSRPLLATAPRPAGRLPRSPVPPGGRRRTMS